jgi:hypothetical protein
MKRRIFGIFVLALVFLAGGCANFIIYKDGKAYYFASRQEGLYKMLCESGDFRRVLDSAKGLSEQTKKALYRYNCETPDAERVKELYASMAVEQRKALREGFKAQGYQINYFPCG